MKKIDMHTHTSASDGILSATQLIEYAVKKGLHGLSITDHDTVESLAEAELEAQGHQRLWFLPGVEFSTEIDETEIHILGYAIDYRTHELLSLLTELKNARTNRAMRMIERLRKLNLDITYQQVQALSTEGVVGRVHIARALMQQRIVYSIEEAFQKYLNRNKPAYVPRFKLHPVETIQLIQKLGGFSVVAHPGLMQNDKLIEILSQEGLNGLEAYYPSHTQEQVHRYKKMAIEFQLLVTGGSDFHAPPSANIRNSDLGECSVSLERIQLFLTEYQQNQNKNEWRKYCE